MAAVYRPIHEAETFVQTDIGLLPTSWRVSSLGEIATVSAGGTPSRNVPSYWDGGIPWITTAEVDSSNIDRATQSITLDGLKNSAAKLLNPGTLLLALYGQGKTRGKVGLLQIAAATNQACAAIELDRGHSSAFVFHFLRAQYENIRKLSNIGNQENLSGAIVRSIKIPLPARSEQQAIAEALSDADALIESLALLLTKRRQIKQGAMQNLLTGRKRLAGFNDSWPQPTLGELFDFKNGLNKAKAFFGHGTPIVNYMDVFSAPALFSEKLVGRVSVVADELRNYDVRKGDVFFTRTSETTNEIGLSSVMVDEAVNAVFSGFVLRARPRDKRLNSRFAVYALRSECVRAQIVARASYTTRALINGRLLGAARVPMPQPREQEALAEILEDMDAGILAVEGKLDKALQLKTAMMQALLTGRIRLVRPL